MKKDPYLCKNICFFNRYFYVDPRVYVSNPETEELVREAIKQLKAIPNPNLILDVGTGAGTIGISLAKETGIKVIGLDVSPLALEVANINRSNILLPGEIKKNLFTTQLSDYIEIIEDEPDLIVADLPYGSNDEKLFLPSLLAKDISKLPKIALFPENSNPMGSYNALIEQIINKGWETTLLIETGLMPEDMVRKNLQHQDLRIEYQLKQNYSVTIISF